MRAKRQKRHFSIFNLIIGVLAVILAVSILVTFFVVRDASNSFYDTESSLYYALTDQQYSGILRRYYDSAAGREDDPRIRKLAEYYAVGRYFEKAFFANACQKADKPDREARYRREMEEVEAQMGQFSAEKDRILQVLP